jgi:trehalose-6-phosphate synthase
MAETLQGCRLPEPHRSSRCRTQVVLPRKQEEDSNRRTKTTKIKITDPCFISLGGKVAAGNELETWSVRHKNIEYAVTDLSKEGFDEYYSGFANRVLWPILHYRLDLAEFARRDSEWIFQGQ